MPLSDKTPLQWMADTERAMLEREAERLAHEDGRAQTQGRRGGFLPGRPWSLIYTPSTWECEKLLELYELASSWMPI